MGPIPGRSSARGGPGWPGHGGRRAAGGGERGSGAAKLVGGPDLGEKGKGTSGALLPTLVWAGVQRGGELRGGRHLGAAAMVGGVVGSSGGGLERQWRSWR